MDTTTHAPLRPLTRHLLRRTRTPKITALGALGLLLIPVCDQCERPMMATTRTPSDLDRSPSITSRMELPYMDLAQRTCALYVAVRSHAWNSTPAFGQTVTDDLVHWNMCPGGTMVACVSTPTAHGEPVITGIPWPY